MPSFLRLCANGARILSKPFCASKKLNSTGSFFRLYRVLSRTIQPSLSNIFFALYKLFLMLDSLFKTE